MTEAYPSSDDFDYWSERDADIDSFDRHYADEIAGRYGFPPGDTFELVEWEPPTS